MEKFEYTFGPLRMEFETFLQNVDGWGPKDVKIKYTSAGPKLPKDVAEYKSKVIEERVEEAEKKGGMFFDGASVRMTDYGQNTVNSTEDDMGLYLELGDTTFFTHVATGQSLDKKVLKDEYGKPTTIREKYIKDPHSFDDYLGNNVGVSTTVLSRPDNALVYVRRSDKLGQYPGRYGVGAAGFMSRDQDMVDGKPNPFRTAQRETNEELGLDTEFGDFKLTGLGRPWDDLHCELWGFTEVDATVEKIRSVPKKHKYEFLKMYDVPFEPKKVMPILKNPSTGWVNAHVASTIDTLLHRYGADEVLEAAYESRRQGLI